MGVGVEGFRVGPRTKKDWTSRSKAWVLALRCMV